METVKSMSNSCAVTLCVCALRVECLSNQMSAYGYIYTAMLRHVDPLLIFCNQYCHYQLKWHFDKVTWIYRKRKEVWDQKSVYFTSRAMLITCASNCYLSPTLSVVLLIVSKLSKISSFLLSIDWCSRIVCMFSEQKIFGSKIELHNYSW
jgi:hypothetical protein